MTTIPLPSRFSMVRHPELRRLVQYYRTVSNGRPTISQSAIDPLFLKHMLARVFYYDYDADADDFRLRLAGEEIRAVLPNARRGARLAEILPPSAQDRIGGYYRRIVREQLMLHSIGRVFFDCGGCGMGERIVVPVSDDTGRAARIFGASFYDLGAIPPRDAMPFSYENVEVTFVPLSEGIGAGLPTAAARA